MEEEEEEEDAEAASSGGGNDDDDDDDDDDEEDVARRGSRRGVRGRDVIVPLRSSHSIPCPFSSKESPDRLIDPTPLDDGYPSPLPAPSLATWCQKRFRAS